VTAGPTAGPIRALVVSNMRPDPGAPARGSFVRDQVAALRTISGLEVDLYEFSPGVLSYPLAAARLRRRYRASRLDVVHAHFGLTQWPAFAVPARARVLTLHGTDLRHPRTRALTERTLRRVDLVATVSESLAELLPDWLPARRRAVLPCGVNLDRFRPISRREARLTLGLDPERPCLLFPADPARTVKRHDLALAVAGDVPLLTAGAVEPDRMPLWINAANAVLVPSDAEGFGLGVLEALACNVPVLATPVGIHAAVLQGVRGTLCEPWDLDRWRSALDPHLRSADPRVQGRERADELSSDRLAVRVAQAWNGLLT
jgi:teichuronic acid biosynthesis glycosyltransferase TuaC